MSWWQWAINGDRIAYCRQCQKRHARRGAARECTGCEHREPPLMHENVPVVRLLLACATQWRTGFAGATGLDYNALFAVAGALRVTIDEIMLRHIAALESLTLEYWRKRQKEKPASPPPGQRPVRRRR